MTYQDAEIFSRINNLPPLNLGDGRMVHVHVAKIEALEKRVAELERKAAAAEAMAARLGFKL